MKILIIFSFANPWAQGIMRGPYLKLLMICFICQCFGRGHYRMVLLETVDDMFHLRMLWHRVLWQGLNWNCLWYFSKLLIICFIFQCFGTGALWEGLIWNCWWYVSFANLWHQALWEGHNWNCWWYVSFDNALAQGIMGGPFLKIKPCMWKSLSY